MRRLDDRLKRLEQRAGTSASRPRIIITFVTPVRDESEKLIGVWEREVEFLGPGACKNLSRPRFVDVD